MWPKKFFSKCDQIRSFLWIWSHLLLKSSMEIFSFCAVVIIEWDYNDLWSVNLINYPSYYCLCLKTTLKRQQQFSFYQSLYWRSMTDRWYVEDRQGLYGIFMQRIVGYLIAVKVCWKNKALTEINGLIM